jgi:hypothetical protein
MITSFIIYDAERKSICIYNLEMPEIIARDLRFGPEKLTIEQAVRPYEAVDRLVREIKN